MFSEGYHQSGKVARISIFKTGCKANKLWQLSRARVNFSRYLYDSGQEEEKEIPQVGTFSQLWPLIWMVAEVPIVDGVGKWSVGYDEHWYPDSEAHKEEKGPSEKILAQQNYNHSTYMCVTVVKCTYHITSYLFCLENYATCTLYMLSKTRCIQTLLTMKRCELMMWIRCKAHLHNCINIILTYIIMAKWVHIVEKTFTNTTTCTCIYIHSKLITLCVNTGL